jgi:hypothetical protein
MAQAIESSTYMPIAERLCGQGFLRIGRKAKCTNSNGSCAATDIIKDRQWSQKFRDV